MLFLLFLSLLLLGSTSRAQERPLYNASKFDYSIPHRHRQDLCARQRLLSDGGVDLARVLEGVDLNVVLTDYGLDSGGNRYLFSLDDGGRIPGGGDGAYPGLFAVLLDEVARRGGFRWRDSFGVVPPLDPHPGPDGNRTWTDVILWETANFDLAVDYYSRSTERKRLGISFPEGWFDSSIIFVDDDAPNSSSQSNNLWTFLAPFEWSVWLLIVVAIVFTGLVYFSLERLDEHADERNLDDNPTGAIFLSAITFTGHFEFRPNSNVARLVSFSWSFWALITAAAYTANLASFLVSSRQPKFGLSTVTQAVQMRVPLCVRANTWNEIYMRNTYGLQVNLVKRVEEDDVFRALRDGECVAALVQESTFRRYERSVEVNADCTLRRSGITVAIIPGGFVTAVDTGTYCTSLVSHVFDLHMKAMKGDGFVERAWMDHLAEVSDHTCPNPDDASDADADEASRLGISDMAGIFVFHAIMCAVSLSFAVFQAFLRHRQAWREGAGFSTDSATGAESNGSHTISGMEDDVPHTFGMWVKYRLSGRNVMMWNSANQNGAPQKQRKRQSMWDPKRTRAPDGQERRENGRGETVWTSGGNFGRSPTRAQSLNDTGRGLSWRRSQVLKKAKSEDVSTSSR